MADGDSQEPKLVLLPGMDGTGWLLENFAAALPASMRPQIVRYPPTGCTSYAEVDAFLRSAGIDDEPFVLLAESYSSVAAIALAAATPTNLKGLVICVGFATPPVRKLLDCRSRCAEGVAGEAEEDQDCYSRRHLRRAHPRCAYLRCAP